SEVEIDALIVRPNVLHCPDQRDRSLLPRFITQILPVFLAVDGDFPNGGNHFRVHRIVWIFRYESTMRLNCRNFCGFRVVGSLFHLCDPCGPSLPRNQPDSRWSTVEIPNFFSWATNHQRSRLDAVLIE